jgi:hypothetical protein
MEYDDMRKEKKQKEKKTFESQSDGERAGNSKLWQ